MYNSTVSFTYKLPSDAPGGEYIITISNSKAPISKKLVRVRDYQRDELIVTTSLSYESYFPGDNVNGKIKVYT